MGGGGGPSPGAMGTDPEMPPSQQGGEEKGVLHIGAAELPEGMELNEGDIVEFRVIGPKDADGDWPVEYNHGEEGNEGMGEGGEGEEKGTSWEEDFRKSMSPRAGGQEGEQAAQ